MNQSHSNMLWITILNQDSRRAGENGYNGFVDITLHFTKKYEEKITAYV